MKRPHRGLEKASRVALLAKFTGIFRRSYGIVDVHAARELVGKGAVLLDVRSLPEWDSGHASDAYHLPLHEVLESGLDVAAGRPVVAICRSGGRSASAARMLSRQGVESYSVRGGMGAWRRAGLEITPPH
ncbi:rhodanese-like domain-containing protein [Rhodococcus sp. ABRD24]|uniref:rhodanese-like domain-containing protein n=1 Tax=Rhodococcus sp. ABRD24 TaxID=2507582 RepID=UPI00103CDEA7|nr:rhodanese-like domain-containing protein [Rhodococcus sp. ABRD24]QBJ96479.1 rhodanese-like domain-containing protein [Rhodococcus sp. ABRD24]